MEAADEGSDLRDRALAPRIDEADAIVVEADPQRLCKSCKGTILCLALDKNRRPRIECFLHLREMHDEVLLDFPVKMK